MYYEPYRGKERARARRKPGCVKRLIHFAIALFVVWAGFMLISGNVAMPDLFGREAASLSVNTALPGGWTNILLLGTDKEESGYGRSDSIIIASISDRGEVKLTSIMRDTMVDMGEEGAHKLNAAYRLGGPELAMRTVNEAFGMNITRYAAVDFSGFASLIDSVGGIEVSLTEQEMDAINQSLSKAYKKNRVYNGVKMEPLTEYGDNIHLSGTHALFYARIRKLDSDYMRASRQRTVIEALIAKVRKTKNPITLASFAAEALKVVTTNVSVAQMGLLGGKILLGGGGISQLRLPADGTYESGTRDGVWAIWPDFEKNRQLLREFIYG